MGGRPQAERGWPIRIGPVREAADDLGAPRIAHVCDALGVGSW